MKKILTIAILTAALAVMPGCKNAPKANCGAYTPQTNSQFNGETYIWESWISPTNRTQEAQL